MPSYLLRFDDICPTMNWQLWSEIELVLEKYDIRPILAIIPDNLDPHLMRTEGVDTEKFWATVRKWKSRGWFIGVHGLHHVYDSNSPGLLGLNHYSEFAGHSYDVQYQKLLNSLQIFRLNDVDPDLWVAPAHSFDERTLEALSELGLKIISDGLSFRPVKDEKGLVWIPQQEWGVKSKQAGLWTFNYHVQNIVEEDVKVLRMFLARYYGRFIRDLRPLLKSAKPAALADRLFAKANRWRIRFFGDPFSIRISNILPDNVVSELVSFSDVKSDFFFTIFTPTFNRRHTLPKVYQSLCNQTFKDFEWVIIDDGSTDNTAGLVRDWQAEDHFPIRYYYQKNSGKHIAWNKAVDVALGRYFVCADSDDEFIDDSLNIFKSAIDDIPEKEPLRFCGVTALCKFSNGSVVDKEFPIGKIESDFIELALDENLSGERWNCVKTCLHRLFRMDESFKGSYLPESNLWLELGKYFKIRLINQPLRIYHHEPDSIMNTYSAFKNSPGARLIGMKFLNESGKFYCNKTRKIFHERAVMYSRSSFNLGISVRNQLHELTSTTAKVLWITAVPSGLVKSCFDRFGLRKVRDKFR